MHPEKLPDRWLYDTMALIGDLDYVREVFLKIPHHDESWLPLRTAIAALWELRQRLFELTALQKARQRDWQKRGQDAQAPPAATRTRSRGGGQHGGQGGEG